MDDALTQALRLAIDRRSERRSAGRAELPRRPRRLGRRHDSDPPRGQPTHTLRYYERIGLVTVPRDGAGHRRYDAACVRRLVFLTRMRVSGMSISDLRRYVDLVDAGEQTLGGCGPQLRVHLGAALNVGLSREEITEAILHAAVYAGFPRALNATTVAREVFAEHAAP